MQTGWGLVHHKLAACLSLVQLHEKAPCGHMVLYHFKSNGSFFSCRFFFLLQIMLKEKKAGQGTDISVCALSGCRFSEQLALQRTRVLCQKEDGLSSDAGQKTVPSSHAQNPNIFIHAWPHTPRNYWVSSSHRTKSKSSPSPSQNPNPRHTPRVFPAFEAP